MRDSCRRSDIMNILSAATEKLRLKKLQLEGLFSMLVVASPASQSFPPSSPTECNFSLAQVKELSGLLQNVPHLERLVLGSEIVLSLFCATKKTQMTLFLLAPPDNGFQKEHMEILVPAFKFNSILELGLFGTAV